MISVKEASIILNVSTTTIRNWIYQGKLTAQKVDQTWQIEEDNLPQAKAKKLQPTKLIADSIVKQIVKEVKNILEPLLQDKQKTIANYETQKSIDQPAKQVYEEIDTLFLENQDLKEKVASMEQAISNMQKQLEALQAQLDKQVIKKEKGEEAQQQVYRIVPDQQIKTQIRDVEKADKWVRENIDTWLDQPSRLNKAKDRTWKELATNEGGKIEINGRMQPSRAYLHIIEKCDKASKWSKIKAKVVLEIFQKVGMIDKE